MTGIESHAQELHVFYIPEKLLGTCSRNEHIIYNYKGENRLKCISEIYITSLGIEPCLASDGSEIRFRNSSTGSNCSSPPKFRLIACSSDCQLSGWALDFAQIQYSILIKLQQKSKMHIM